MSLPPLDARIPVLLGRLRAAPSDAQAGLRRHLEVIAKSCGRTLDEAIAELAPQPQHAEPAQRPENDSQAAIPPVPLRLPPKGSKPRPASQERPRNSISERIAAELHHNPTASDRSIARAAGCSPTTAGHVRQALGIEAPIRSVQRGGQRYEMTASKAPRLGT